MNIQLVYAKEPFINYIRPNDGKVFRLRYSEPPFKRFSNVKDNRFSYADFTRIIWQMSNVRLHLSDFRTVFKDQMTQMYNIIPEYSIFNTEGEEK
jgi:hypothetical protein